MSQKKWKCNAYLRGRSATQIEVEDSQPHGVILYHADSTELLLNGTIGPPRTEGNEIVAKRFEKEGVVGVYVP